ncbi:MAG: TetR/AcrR family transcriptional regulator [Sphingomonas sp.]
MKRETRGEGPGRLGREDWIALARKVLVQSGIEDVKVVPLADRMQVTRGSFYWHFANRKDLLDALLSDWEVRNYFEIAQVRGALGAVRAQSQRGAGGSGSARIRASRPSTSRSATGRARPPMSPRRPGASTMPGSRCSRSCSCAAAMATPRASSARASPISTRSAIMPWR